VQSDLDELLNEAKNSEEKAKKAMVDAARLADELRAEQDHAQTQEKLRKALETQIKELQVLIYIHTQSLQTDASKFIPTPDE
jgi:TPP-dependent trihydroxycyclohexane-1,2-dione (THcHDO) dehydratase